MDVDGKMAIIHAVAAILAAYVSFMLSNGSIPAIGQNQALAALAGVVILIIVGNLSERIFGKEEVGGTKGWLWSGIVPFVFVWFISWTIFINL
ncbi:MAG: hypothetical protein CIT01_08620 [Methanobacterium sp. BRmetb2]|jgi:hypothetical protein|nr:MAG: hypothetical protein CIT01_08620 [Methanobacterium sp. BRmetb2]